MTTTRSAENSFSVPLGIVGSSTFGREPKINDEHTYNMFIADDALINFAGYKFRLSLLSNGRGIFSSKKASLMFAVSENSIFEIGKTLDKVFVANIQSSNGDVFIDEDILNNIAFCDGLNITIYNYVEDIDYIVGTNPYGTSIDNSLTIAQSGNTVTGTGTTFTADMVGGTIYYADKSSALITAYASATSITVNVSKTVSATSPFLITTPLDFTPNYICFHDGRFVSTSSKSGTLQIGQWRLSTTFFVEGGATYVVFPQGNQFQGGFQTKPDLPISVLRMPGRANQIFIMGSTVTEPWFDYGLAKFPYIKNTSFNLDFGCLNPATIATLNNISVWLGTNERAGPVIMYSTGQDIKSISTDGIDYLFERLNRPEVSYGFTYLQSGHLFYFITFYDPSDNITLAYDFKTEKFYNLCNENLDFHIAKKIVFFNNKYYFISIVDGNIYEINSQFTTYEYANNSIKQIPRARILKTYRTDNDVPAILNDLFFVVEQGIDAENTGQGNNLSSVNIINGGQDYTTCTALIEGDGSGANITVNLISGVITSITINEVGIGYSWMVITLLGDGKNGNVEPVLNVNVYVPRSDISVSYDGAYTWSNFDVMKFNTYAKYKNRFYYNGGGYSNEFTLQFRIHCNSRFVCKEGKMSFYR